MSDRLAPRSRHDDTLRNGPQANDQDVVGRSPSGSDSGTSPASPSERSPFNHAWLNRVKAEIGVDLMGVLAVDESSHPDFIQGVKVFLPKARAAVIIMNELPSETMNLVMHPAKYAGKPKTGALLAPMVDEIHSELDLANMQLAKLLKREGYRSIVLPRRLPMYAGGMKFPLSFCHIAEAAGMGTIGTHTLIITPEFGTRVRLACLLTEAPLQTTKRQDPVDDCTHCLDCVKVCPIGAISSPGPGLRYEVDAARCKFYRDNVDNCGLCQKACSFATRHSETVGPPLTARTDSWGVREFLKHQATRK
ncbi:MAG: 4Fe-4S binding protein [Sphingomonadaceae bacterium]